jgi:ActR/RegA family two-component response regulator
VEAAEHERLKRKLESRDFWVKVCTAIFAALAAAASTINLVRQW